MIRMDPFCSLCSRRKLVVPQAIRPQRVTSRHLNRMPPLDYKPTPLCRQGKVLILKLPTTRPTLFLLMRKEPPQLIRSNPRKRERSVKFFIKGKYYQALLNQYDQGRPAC